MSVSRIVHSTIELAQYSAPQSKKAICAFQIKHKLLSFTWEDSWQNHQTINAQ